MLIFAFVGAGLFCCIGCQPQPETETDFLDAHWKRPLPPQGPPPAVYSPREASLDAATCGSCHTRQFQDWKQARHSRTMAPGILWQLRIFDQAEANECLDCHAPLAEQKALVAQTLQWPARPDGPAPDYVPEDLHMQGLTCAACHVRGHERFGPPSRSALTGRETGLPHGGFTPKPDFEDSRFCAGCHQFPDDGPRLNGKLRQDTYNEWLRSDFSRRGQTCQSCHMPDRRHQWRGITHPPTVRDALDVELELVPLEDGRARLNVEVTNSGTGHHFPAYLVPRVELKILPVDPMGREQAPILNHVFQWRTNIELTEEQFDTRLPSGASVRLGRDIPLPVQAGWSLRAVLDVAPKEHYERMYRDMLKQISRMDPDTAALLRLALGEAEGTRYRTALLERPFAPAEPVAN